MPANGPEPIKPQCASRRWLLVAIGLAAGLQAVATWRAPVIAKDGITFINVARRLPREPLKTIRSADQHPGYPVMILVSHALVGRFLTRDEPQAWAASAHLATWVCGLLGIGVGWLLARRVFNARVAAVAALLLAVLPALRQNATDGLSDTPHVLFFMLACWLAAEGFARWRLGWFAGAGAASGMAYLVRPEGLGVALAVGAALGLLALRRQRPRRRTLLLALGCLAAATAAVAAPYTIAKGRLTSKKNPVQILLSVLNLTGAPAEEPSAPKPPPQPKSGPAAPAAPRPPASPAPRPAAPTPAAPGAAPEAPPGPTSRLEALAVLLEGMLGTLRYTLLLPLALGIFVSRRWRAQPEACLLALLLVGLYTVVMSGLQIAAGYMSDRHLLPLAALAAPWLGAGTICLAGGLHALFARRRGTGRWALGALVTLMVLEQGRACLHPIHKRHAPALHAARWVRDHATEGDQVLSNSWYVAFYSDVPGLRVDTPGQLAALLAPRGASPYRFFVLETCEGTGSDPAWLPLLQAHYREVAAETLEQRWKAIIFEARKRESMGLRRRETLPRPSFARGLGRDEWMIGWVDGPSAAIHSPNHPN